MEGSAELPFQQKQQEQEPHKQQQLPVSQRTMNQSPSLTVGSAAFEPQTPNAEHQNFLLSVLLLQQSIQQRQQQRQQQQELRGLPWQLWHPDHRKPSDGVSPQAHLQQTPASVPSATSSSALLHQSLVLASPPTPAPSGGNHGIDGADAAIASLIREAPEPRKQALRGLRIATQRLERQSLKQPWGLEFVSTQPNVPRASPTTTASSSAAATVASLWKGTRAIVVRYDRKHAPFADIVPGDIILAIDGKSVASWCNQNSQNGSSNTTNSSNKTTTAEIASYLRSALKVTITLLKHPSVQASTASAIAATAASRGHPQPPGNHHRSPYTISNVANQAWKQLLDPQSLATSSSDPTWWQRRQSLGLFTKPKPVYTVYRNPWFWEVDNNGNKVNIPYDDNEGSLDYELRQQQDGTRAALFLPPIPSTRESFCQWLAERKSTWRKRYKVYPIAADTPTRKSKKRPAHETEDDCESHVANADFWSHQGFATFADWLRHRSIAWHRSYSWNKRKRKKIQEECFEKVVVLPVTMGGGTPSPAHATNHSPAGSCPAEEFYGWLEARRFQWKMARRKRKRQRLFLSPEGIALPGDADKERNQHLALPSSSESHSVAMNQSESPRDVFSFPVYPEDGMDTKPSAKRKLQLLSPEDEQMAYIDEILEEKEKETKELLRKRAERPPIDIVRFFDATQGIPDDVVAHCFAFLDPIEHGKLLAINKKISKSLKERHGVWQRLCPSNWTLPRRPRKPWHELYLTKLRKERELHQKRWDDLLAKCSAALVKRDDLQKVEKLIEKAQADFGFDVNYCSGVVCERNSVLNLAVIHGRVKIVRWLVDVKGADIETCDRGSFTPLLNAAWSGNRTLVRFFLQRRSNRNVLGTQHYTKGIAPPGFRGKTAEEWAEHRGHQEIAQLIRLGL